MDNAAKEDAAEAETRSAKETLVEQIEISITGEEQTMEATIALTQMKEKDPLDLQGATFIVSESPDKVRFTEEALQKESSQQENVQEEQTNEEAVLFAEEVLATGQE